MLSKILYFTNVTDAGEFGAANCPECGAEGRYILWFVCEDGQRRGAMRGCVKKYPLHKFAREHERIMEKQDIQKKRLASWDIEMLEAIENFAAGTITETLAASIIRTAKRKRENWMKGRRW